MFGLFRAVSETGVGACVSGIEWLSGGGALESMKRQEADLRELSELLKVGPLEVVARTKKLAAQLKEKERHRRGAK